LLHSYEPRHGPALGLFESAVYPTGSCPLVQDDAILLFTDGLFEVSNSSEEEFGQDRLLDTVRKHVQLPTTRLLDTILEEVRNFGDADEFEDDVCLLAMEAHRIGTVC
jgi:sigma-B regulation protein RsbU (phosphoserine phosphatase)